jgi:hypothetical protein
VDAGKVQITWTTEIPATSEVDYGETPSYGSTASTPGETTLHLVTLGGLSPSVLYHYRVRGATAACGGGSVTSGDASFSTGFVPAPGPGEVSGRGSGLPLLVTKNGDGSLSIAFEALGAADGYNLYVGTLDGIYDHGDAAANICAAATEVVDPGRRRIAFPESGPAGYFLVSGFNASGEGATGFASNGTEVPPDQSTCPP